MPESPESEAVGLSDTLGGELSFADGRYIQRAVLGVGGEKVVYLVHDTELDRECALALINAPEKRSERLRREARTVARLGPHPNVVTIFDIGKEEGRTYLVSEYLPGGDLRSELEDRDGPLPADRAARIGLDLLEALDFIHDEGLVHRDIKPDNVWLTDDGTAKLGDFGVAFSEKHTETGDSDSIVGTPAYMAPEQLRGGPIDGRADLYALGCMLYELTTDRPPFVGSMRSVATRHVDEQPDPPSEHNPAIPDTLEALVLDLLAKDVDDRPQGASSAAPKLRQLSNVAADASQPLSVAPEPVSPEAVSDLPLVGREEEFERMEGALERALRGDGSLLALTGEPGIGKSALADRLADRARAGRARVARGECISSEGAEPFAPFVEAIGSLTEHLTDDQLTELAGAAGEELRRLVPELPGGSDPPPEPSPHRHPLFEAVADFLEGVAELDGLAVVIEDLHWADAPTLSLIEHLAGRLRDSRVLLLVTYRDGEMPPEHPLTEIFATCGQREAADCLYLDGLPEPAIAELAGRILDEQPADELAAFVVRESGGNPFFARELLQHLVDRDRLDDIDFSAPADTPSYEIPSGVRDVVEKRLAGLSKGCEEMLQLTAVMRGTFRWDVLSDVHEGGESELLDALDEALEANVLRELSAAGGGTFAFRHDLLRQAILRDLSAPRRIQFHSRIAEAMVETFGEQAGEHLSEIAHHYHRAAPAGHAEQAVEYGLQAARRAMGALAYEEAVGHFTRVLEILQEAPTPDEKIAEIRAARGRARIAAASVEEAYEDLSTALELHGDDPPFELLSDVCFISIYTMRVETCLETAEWFHELARERNEDDYLAEAVAWLAIPYHLEGDMEGAMEQIHRAYELRDDRWAVTYTMIQMNYYHRGEYEALGERCLEDFELAKEADDAFSVAELLAQHALSLTARGRYAEARRRYEEARRHAEENGIEGIAVRARAVKIGLYIALDAYDIALEQLPEIRKQAMEVPYPPATTSATLDMLYCYTRTGELAKALELDEQAVDELKTIQCFQEWNWDIRYGVWKAETALLQAEWDAAREFATEAADAAREVRPKYVVLALLARSRALHALDRTEEALEDLQAARQRAEELGSPHLELKAVEGTLELDPSPEDRERASSLVDDIEEHIDDPELLEAFRSRHDRNQTLSQWE